MENKYKTIIILILACFVLAIGYIAGHKNSTISVASYTDTVSVVHVKYDSIVLTDTVKSIRFKHIRDSVYIPNPLDSSIYADYIKLNDSLRKLNIDKFVILDTIVKNDTINIKCNSVKSIISLAYRPKPRFDTVRYVTKTVTMPDNNWRWREFGAGSVFGAGIYALIIGLSK
jgi:hypothetical protein